MDAHNRTPLWRHLFTFFQWRHSLVLLLGILSSLATSGIDIAAAILLGKIFGILSNFGTGALDGLETMAMVTTLCLVLCGLGGAAWIAHSAFLLAWVLFSELQANSAREMVFIGLLSNDIAWWDTQVEGVQSLQVRIETQIRELQLATSQVFGEIIHDLFTGIAALSVSFYYSWRITLVLFSTVPVSLIILSLVGHSIEDAIRLQKQCLARASKHAAASMSAIGLVKSFNGIDQETWQYSGLIKRSMAHFMKSSRASATQISYAEFWLSILFVLGFAYGVALVNDGADPGSIVTTFYATLTALQCLQSSLPQWTILAKGMSAGNDLGHLISQTRSNRNQSHLTRFVAPDSCAGKIRFSAVNFAYPSNPTKNAIQNLSFDIPAGIMAFIVGESGSGKSSVGNLLARFYEPTNGQIYVDGWPLPTLHTTWLRRNVTLVQQSSVLFDDTFSGNIALGHATPHVVSREDILEACEVVMLQSTVAGLPDGLETQVGPNGHTLSGGQKQKLSLARAKLRNPPVLVLDETTSGLDQIGKKLVMEALRRWRRGKTTIIISHDVAEISDDDYVYVLAEGSLTQSGLRKALASDPLGLFARMVSSGTGEIASPALAETGSFIDSASYSGIDAPESDLLIKGHVGIRRMSAYDMPLKYFSLGSAMAQSTITRSQRLCVSPLANADAQNNTFSQANASFGLEGHELSEMQQLARARPFLPLTSRHLIRSSTKISRTPLDRSTESEAPWTGRPLPKISAGQPLKTEYRAPSASKRRPSLANRARKMSLDLVLSLGASIQESRSGLTRDRRPISRPLDTEEVVIDHLNTKEKQQSSLKEIVESLWATLSIREKVILVSAITVCFLVAGANPAFSYCFARLLAAMWSTGNKLSAGQLWAILLVVIAIIDGFAIFLSHYMMDYVGEVWVNKLRVKSLKNILEQPLPWFQDSVNSAGRMGDCLDRNAEEMRNIVSKFFPMAIIASAMMFGSLVWAMALSWRLSLVTLAPMPIFLCSIQALSIVSMKWELTYNQAAIDTNLVFGDALAGLKVIQAYCQEDLFISKYLKSASKTFDTGVKKALRCCALYGFHGSLNPFFMALIFYYATVLVARTGQASLGNIIEVVNLILFAITVSTAMLSSMPQMSAALSTASQMLHYANLPPNLTPDLPPDYEALCRLATPLPIKVRKLEFTSPSRPNNQILRGITMQITGGQCTVIVGPSGCGKTTLISILLGLYTATDLGANGSTQYLTFCQVPYKDIDVTHLRSLIGYVPQSPFLFPISIIDNILYGVAEESAANQASAAQRAAQEAGIHDFILSLPQGYDTIVGDGGLALSGGQAQRINIARALAKNPQVLLLDEPTSALDPGNAQLVRGTIARLVSRRGHGARAVVMVTHDKDMMRIADRILMMTDGFIAEEGTYSELLSRRGKFAQMLSEGEWRGETDLYREESTDCFRDVDWTSTKT